MDKEKKLREIFDNDPLGLLNIKPSNTPSRNEDERLVASFQEIVDFYEKNSRLPEQGSGLQEHQLFSRLKSLRDNPIKVEILKEYDKHGLLKFEKKEIHSLEDVLNDDLLGLLKDDSEGLFDLKNISQSDKIRAEADFVARRKPCKNFEEYEQLFKDAQKDLSEGKRKLIPFKEDNLVEGNFYVHNGVLLLLEKIELTKEEKSFSDGTRVRKDGRTKCIFENGTESNMLYRSLAKVLYSNGHVVTKHSSEVNYQFIDSFSVVNEDDLESGFIYILKSKSDKQEIKQIQNLYKVGFSSGPVEERIKNSLVDPTYLMADVRIIMTYKCYNMNPQKFESLIHSFFGACCLDIDVFGKDGKRYAPREWFVVPISVIEQAIQLIISGEIVKYRYNDLLEEIELK